MFTIRVYGILMNENQQVLVTDEYIRGHYYTKFGGGGLELGEGTIDCLKREFIEEMNLKVEVIEHIYTTDFYQRSAFNPEHQMMAIYYRVKALEPIKAPISTAPFQFSNAQQLAIAQKQEVESFRFINWDDFSADAVTLPIDKVVATLIKEKYAHAKSL
jgi:ADP-ribose pyrophosphatase YjhB (NUDIX family)